jgi:hypothetical protein
MARQRSIWRHGFAVRRISIGSWLAVIGETEENVCSLLAISQAQFWRLECCFMPTRELHLLNMASRIGVSPADLALVLRLEDVSPCREAN